MNWRDLLMLVLAIGLLAATCVCVGEDAIPDRAGICDLKATAALAPLVQHLRKHFPLQKEVRIVVISRKVQAWTDFDPVDTIYIKDEGAEQNRACLKHEWQHRWDRQNGRPMTEEAAREAERR